MKPSAPARVEWNESWWSDPPPALSPRCVWWVKRIANGWKPNKRVKRYGYYDAAFFYGVWIWEYLIIICRVVEGSESGAMRPEDVQVRNELLVAAGLDPMPPVWSQWHVHRGIVSSAP